MRQILREIERVNLGCVYVFSFIILWVYVQCSCTHNVYVQCTYFIRILYILCIFLCVHIILLVFCGHVCVRVNIYIYIYIYIYKVVSSSKLRRVLYQ